MRLLAMFSEPFISRLERIESRKLDIERRWENIKRYDAGEIDIHEFRRNMGGRV